MADDSVLEKIRSEFKLWGVKPKIEDTAGGHIRLVWQATPDKEVRTTILPKTGSDWRGWLNQRAHVRRLFKQDGLSLKEPPKPVPALHRALGVAEPVEPQIDQFRCVRAELGELTEMVLDLASIVSSLRETVQQQLSTPAPAPEAPPPPPPVSPPPEPKPAPVRSPAKTIDHVSFGWNTTDALAKSMGVNSKQAYGRLYYLMRTGSVEFTPGFGGRWRRTPPPPKPTIKPKLKLKPNGFHNKPGRRRLGNGAHA